MTLIKILYFLLVALLALIAFGIPSGYKAHSVESEAFEPKAYLAQYTDDPFAEKVINCESNWKAGAVGDSGLALGRPQFHEETFYRMQKASGDNPMYQWGDERAELRIFAWGLKNRPSEWTCSYKTGKL